MHRQVVLVAYDISDPRRLAAAREAVSGWAAGGQRSVFECFAAPRERPSLAREMRRALELRSDRLALMLPRPEGARALGIGAIARDEPLIWVG